MQRRQFIETCSGALLCSSLAEVALAAGDGKPRLYQRVRLADENGAPLRASQVPPRRNLVFAYPYVATPAFLLNLAKPPKAGARLSDSNGNGYDWPGGVGPARAIVAFSAICAHQLAYPAREISFISFRGTAAGANKLADVIHCCAEHSQYDPAAGARVVAGPAPQPLTAILLEHDPRDDSLTAIGTLGGEVYDAFFEKYEFKLTMEHDGRQRDLVAGDTRVQPLEKVCRQQIRC
jgi:arsenite oxidase small subunit